MKKKLLSKQRVIGSLLGMLCCLSFTACNEDKADLLSGGDGAILQLGASVTGLTRANDAGFEAGDSLGVFVVKWKSNAEQDSLMTVGNYADNICFRLDKLPNDWIADHLTYYPNDDSMIDLYAYYPHRAPAFSSGTMVNLTVAANQSSYRNYTLSDFMVAQTDSVSRSPFKVPLVFDHKLSQMVFELKPGTGFTANDLMSAKVKVINAITDATFNLAAIKGGSPVAGTTRADIIPCGTWTESGGLLTGMKAIVVPQPINTTTYIQVTIGSRTFTYKPMEAKNMNAGCSRKFIITINNTGLDITTAINPWDNCPLVEGDAEEEWPVVFMQDFTPTGTEKVGTEVMLTDKRDNIIYRCIKMADGRWWMGENLRFDIAGSVFYSNDSVNLKTYGRLYNWLEAMNATPEKWIMPTDDEWKALEIAIGMSTDDANNTEWRNSGDVGTKLKPSGSSKLEMLLGGYYYQYQFLNIFQNVYYWSSTSTDNKAWSRLLSRIYSGIFRTKQHTNNSFSVRCILKEKETTQYMQDFVPNPADTVGTELMLTDKRDNIVYRCIKMADGRWWMGENLRGRFGTFVEGQPTETYGLLYDWDSSIDYVPDGWSLPTNAEYLALADALGGKSVAGGKMKSTSDWSNNGNGTNSSGFYGLPSGHYNVSDDHYSSKGTWGGWWSIENYGNWGLYYKNTSLDGPSTNDNRYHFSVRCVKNL